MKPIVFFLCACGVSLAQQSQGPGEKPGVTTPGVRISMARLQPDAVLPIAGMPDWIAIDADVWVANEPRDSVVRIDPNRNVVVATIAVGKRPGAGLAAGFGSLWVPCCGESQLVRLDLATGAVTARIPTTIADPEGSIAVGAGSVWLLTDARGTLARFDPATGTKIAEIAVANGSYAAAFGEGAVWVTSTRDSVLSKVDVTTNRVAATIAVGKAPRFLAVGEGSVWTLNQGDGSITRVDPARGAVLASIAPGIPGPGGEIAVGEGSVWVTAFEYPITRIDPRTNTVVQRFHGAGGDAIRVGHGSLWLSNLRAQNVWRLDPRKIAALSLE